MGINWTVRLKNRLFWLAAIPAALLLVKAVADAFGVQVDLTDVQQKALGIVEAAFMLLAAMGVVADPTTEGIGDSDAALTYEEPRKSARHMG